ncbi:MAG: molybdenum cofactor biosynthesis protein MoaE [Gemmatimonadota bacterium]
MFAITNEPVDPTAWAARVGDRGAGALVVFEGRVRDRAHGRVVRSLSYEAYETLAVKEGERVLAEAREKYPILGAACVHRVGDLAIGDCAVWIGVTSAHRAEAFEACRYIIDEIKHRLPIWKKEFFEDGDSGWVNCERCAQVGVERR